jgi:hypothetical protein
MKRYEAEIIPPGSSVARIVYIHARHTDEARYLLKLQWAGCLVRFVRQVG